MTKADLGNVDEKVREALHVIFAGIFDKICEATDGAIEVEDLRIVDYSVRLSVSLKPREDEDRFGGTPQEKFRRGIEKGRYRVGSTD